MKCPRCGTVFIGDKCPKCGYEPTEYDVAIDTLMQLTGVGRKRAEELYSAGYRDIKSIANESEENLSHVYGIGHELAKKIIKDAKDIVSETNEQKEFIKICHVCGAIIPPGQDKCPQCGTPVEESVERVDVVPEENTGEEKIENMALCPFCGALISKDAEVCPVCGASVKNVPLEEPRPMEDPMEVLKRFFGVSEIPEYHEEEEKVDIRVCPNCGAVVVNRDTCPLCGAAVPPPQKTERHEEIEISETLNLCPNCGAIIPHGAAVCPVCGISLEEEKPVIESIEKQEPPEIQEEKPEAFLEPEELDEIARVVEESKVKESEEGISPEDMTELIEAMNIPTMSEQKEELTETDLGDIQKDVVPQQEVEKINVEEPIPPPAEKKEEPPVLMPSRNERINTLIYSFGTREDIIAFMPLTVSLIYLAASGFLSSGALSVLTRTVSMFMAFTGFLLAIETYLTLKQFDHKELIYGSAFSAIPFIPLVPGNVGLYLTVLVSGAMIFLRSKRSFNYWLPLTAASFIFAAMPYQGAIFSVIFMAFVGVHLISRYEEISVPVPLGGETVDPDKIIEEGMEEFRNKNYYDAIYLLRKAMKVKGEDVNILNTLGLAYGRIGNSDMARSMFKKVLEIDPKFKYAWNNLGNVYAREGNYEEAMKCYKKALEIDPNYDDAMLNMGYIMIRRGNYDEAVKIANKIKASA